MKGNIMVEPNDFGDAPFFLGNADQLRAFSRWIDDFERAAVSRVEQYSDAPFVVDIRKLNRVLAVGDDYLDCLNIVEVQNASEHIANLQRDLAPFLAAGWQGNAATSDSLLGAERHFRKTLHDASQYFRWIAVLVRDELEKIARANPPPDLGADTPTKSTVSGEDSRNPAAEKKTKRGRNQDTDPVADENSLAGYEKSGLPTVAQYAAREGLDVRATKLAHDRARKRRAKASAQRNK